MMDRLSGKVCVVIGVLETLGEAVAQRFADKGGVVVGTDKVDHGAGRLSLVADVCDEDQVRIAYERV